ncbi:hypothetical protein RAMDARK_0422 [Rickettsia amblyommatis str. Darkwater]|nr:hypothetical protein RAMDARK_0422 [Rickettsia amblyommatis str. Darkwater]
MSISNYITVVLIVDKSRSSPTTCIVICRYGNSSIDRYDCLLAFSNIIVLVSLDAKTIFLGKLN